MKFLNALFLKKTSHYSKWREKVAEAEAAVEPWRKASARIVQFNSADSRISREVCAAAMANPTDEAVDAWVDVLVRKDVALTVSSHLASIATDRFNAALIAASDEFYAAIDEARSALEAQVAELEKADLERSEKLGLSVSSETAIADLRRRASELRNARGEFARSPGAARGRASNVLGCDF